MTAQAPPLRGTDMSIRGYPPEHWLKLAEEAWERTLELKDPAGRREMEIIACRYERLAEFARRVVSRIEAGIEPADTEIIPTVD